MSWRSSDASLLTAWRAEVEFAQEAGNVSLLEISDGPSLLTPLSQTPAAQTFLEQRADAAAPLILAGGLGLAWLNLLLFHAENRRTMSAPTLYSGCDDACRMASHATAIGATSALRVAPGHAPEGWVEFLTPQARPGASGSWDTLPMWALGDEQGQAVAEQGSPHSDFQAWLAGGLIFFLVAVSLLAGALLNAAPAP